MLAVFPGVCERQPRGVAMLVVVSVPTVDARGFGDAGFREAVSRLQSTFAGRFRNTVIVLEGTGFAAATLRSVTWAISSVVRSRRVPTFCDSAREAVQVLARTNADLGLVEGELLDAIRLARATAAVAPPPSAVASTR